MADDQGWGDMAYNGHEVVQTPNFDAMAAQTLRFDHFYAAAPYCSPTRASVMTGRNPNRMACFSWGRTLRPQELTIAEILKEAGYKTGHFGKWHLGSVEKGSPVNPGTSGFETWLSAPNFFDNDPILSREGVAEKQVGESSMITVDAAIEFIEEHHGTSDPYLAVVWFGSPHGPHEAAENDRMLYTNSEEQLQHFYGEITGMDRAVGKLRETVRSLPDNEQTVIWYCSDNGGLPKVGSTGGRNHKGSIYEGGLRVPSILDWPAVILTPRASGLPAVTSDILPTVLDMAGVENPTVPLDGISLLSTIQGESQQRPGGMGFWHYPGFGVGTPSKKWMEDLILAQAAGGTISDSTRLRLDAGKVDERYTADSIRGHAAWLDWPYKLHHIDMGDESAYFELYNLDSDPMESEDIATEQQARVVEMGRALEDWQQSVVGSLNGEDY
ncbi:UNVERIFIED_CONTAM: hypothetical protein GTU68_048671 [Idotea baltica]|nr:hypothetical protein [Idotea baltica]